MEVREGDEVHTPLHMLGFHDVPNLAKLCEGSNEVRSCRVGVVSQEMYISSATWRR
jgi:hypothetical protein